MELPKEEVARHFSHHHPMVRTNSPPAGAITCSGCNLKIVSAKDYYRCKICPFFLHQVCYNMPKKTRHPAHPVHYLNLLVMPSSAKGTFNCKACGQHVTGFYYNCADCGICYHILCSALPLSIVINSHSHTLKLEFSLPYDFECDLCQQPCYNGWLYRCDMCEFDTHLACAIVNRRTQSLQHPFAGLPDPLTRQIIYSSASLTETNRKIDYDSESIELMQLVAQGIARGFRESMRQETIHGALAGWDEKLQSPKKKFNKRNGQIEYFRSFQIKQDIAAISPDPGGQLENLNHSSLLSGDLSTLPSYQFSDSCFSIDIARSYSSYDQLNQERNEASHHDPEVVQDVKNTTYLRNDSMLDRITGNLDPGKQEPSKPGFSRMGSENRLSEAFLTRGGTHRREELSQKKLKKEKETKSSSGFKDQSPVSDREMSDSSCCSQLLQCFYQPKYNRETIHFKNGRM